jgi:pimeloyl-ACP methyl ester carboxylesterase
VTDRYTASWTGRTFSPSPCGSWPGGGGETVRSQDRRGASKVPAVGAAPPPNPLPQGEGENSAHGGADLFVNGRRLETAWWGPAPDDVPTTLVLLHEGLGCVALWRDFPEALAAATGGGVFAYSRFGYGASDPVTLPRPMTYMHHEALSVLPHVLDAAGIRRAILVGHSDGGSIAAIHAGAIQDPRVAGVVLIAAHFFVEDINIASIAGIKNTYEQGDLRRRLARYHRDADMAFRGWSDAWLDPRFRAFDIADHVLRTRVPVLALQGADDPYGTPEQLRVLERAASCSVETRLITGARHAPHLEATSATLAAIVPFVRNVLMDAAA